MTKDRMAGHLTYRNGFVVSRQDIDLAIIANWNRTEVDGWRISTHPDTQIGVYGVEGARLVAFGQAFLPERELYASAEAFAALAEALRQGPAAFHDALDEAGGRFALLVQGPDDWRVYHDAIGSRTVFYSRSRPAFASHVELLAELLGLRIHEDFVAFVGSSGYLARDVKYLPGATTAYDDLRQLTPNTALVLDEGRPRRYWPRRPREPSDDINGARAALVAHVEALGRHLAATGQRPVLGMTGGRDSRILLAGLKELNPRTYTWVRSAGAEKTEDKESRHAAELARIAKVTHDVLPIAAPATLNNSGDEVGQAYRRNTGYVRGIDGGWQRKMQGLDYETHCFIRGFGGEILRGFYQKSRNSLKRLNAKQLAGLYDVNAGFNMTRHGFREFISLTEMADVPDLGYDLNDIFYWEHRMGTWGASALSEGDIAVRGLSGYNSRRLYERFLALDWSTREACVPIHGAVETFSPELASLPYI